MEGQASTEYVGVVALVALVLAAAGAAVATPHLPIARQIKVALCVVGGDVCRTSDARAQGLDPCVVRAHEGERRTKLNLTIASYTVGDRFAIERRSDGTARVIVASDDEGGLSAGLGFRLGAGADVGGELSGGVGWTSGYAWELPDEEALERFLATVRRRPGKIAWDLARRDGTPRPTERFSAISGRTGADAAATILALDQPLVTAGGRGALGKRTRGGRTSWYFDASHEGAQVLGGLVPGVELHRAGKWILELSDRPRALWLTTSLPKGVEIEAALDLERPGNAAVARELLRRPSPQRAAALGRHIAEHGVVQRRVYRSRELASDPELAVKLGVAGVDHSDAARERTLVAAEVLRPTGNSRRADCLGL